MLPFLLPISFDLALQQRHIPHDSSFAVAIGRSGGGGLETVATGDDPVRFIRSSDDQLTWSVLSDAGMERSIGREVAWYETPAGGVFLIGTDNGVYSYDPNTGQLVDLSAGLGADKFVIELAVAAPGQPAPALLLTNSGTIYLWRPGVGVWEEEFSVRRSVDPGQAAAAIVPHFDPGAGPGPLQAMLVAIDGRLLFSLDGGDHWSTHPQFRNYFPEGWSITAIAVDDSFEQNGILLLGRTRPRPQNPHLNEGEILRSTNGGRRFVTVRTMETGVGALIATPPGPSGTAHYFAAGYKYPGVGEYQGVGILRSDNGGRTWNDFGNEQDFRMIEEDPDHNALPLDLDAEQDFALSPDFSTDGRLLYARGEGLFRSDDAGLTWRQLRLRPEEDARGLATGRRTDGEIIAFGASYGSSLMIVPTGGSPASIADFDCPIAYQKAVVASPNYAHDGTVVFGGSADLCFWFDPEVPVANPYGTTGFVLPPLTDLATSQRLEGYPRTIAISPHYDGRGLPGSDQTVIWSAWDQFPMRTGDGGLTGETLPFVAGGGDAPFMDALVIAPTYDALSAAGRTDAYGASERTLYRLEDRTWVPLLNTNGTIRAIAVDPSFRRPDNPRLFVATSALAAVLEIVDQPGAPQVRVIGTGLNDLRTQQVAVPPDFAANPVLYALSWGCGVFRYDLSQGASGTWDHVGADRPLGWGNWLGFSPNFATDRTLFLGTSRGVVSLADQPLAAAFRYETDYSRDDHAAGFVTYEPNLPANTQPLRPWPWREVPSFVVPDLPVTDDRLMEARYDGAALECTGYASGIRLRTIRGPGRASVTMSVFDYWSGQPLGSVSEDLNFGPALAAHEIELSWGQYGAVRVRLDVAADQDETFLFDTFLFER